MRYQRSHLQLASPILVLVRDTLNVIVRGSVTPKNAVASRLAENAIPDVITAINVARIMICKYDLYFHWKSHPLPIVLHN